LNFNSILNLNYNSKIIHYYKNLNAQALFYQQKLYFDKVNFHNFIPYFYQKNFHLIAINYNYFDFNFNFEFNYFDFNFIKNNIIAAVEIINYH
jgi:hypothetical protein